MKNGLYINENLPLRSSLKALGNTFRIKKVIERAKKGESITLGFFGGSITAGSGAGEGKNYVRCVTDYFKEKFPDAEIKCVNAGIGATGSRLGVFRIEGDVLTAKPDILVIDHSVNDNGDETRSPGSTNQTYECVIRKALLSGAAVVPLCVCNREGVCQQDMNFALAAHYDLPFISMLDGIYMPLIKSGHYAWEDYSGDSVHPNAEGHAMLAELICNYFETVLTDECVAVEYKIPDPLFGDRYMNTEMLDGSSLLPDALGAFRVGDAGFHQFKGGWIAEDKGESMRFTLKGCREVLIAFVREPNEKAGSVLIEANGKGTEINSFFKNGWGRYAETCSVFSSEQSEDVEIALMPIEKGKRFALLRILVVK